MRRAVRRLTWILLSFALTTVLCFGLLGTLVPKPASTLPRFFNPAPRNVRDLAFAALDNLERDTPGAPQAARELARLGGAALPYVLPNLERLDGPARERVALALAPVALRMRVARSEELANGKDAVTFWLRFWQDRSVDFREPVVRRLVARLSERSLALRREDVVELDTYALPELVKALGAAQGDIERVARLTSVLSHVAGTSWTLADGASPSEAELLVRRWRLWWEEHGSDYAALDGPHRVAAMIKETAYGRWLASVLRGELGRTSDGRTGLELLRASAPRTLGLLAAVLALGSLLGSAAETWLARAAGTAQRRLLPAALGLAAVPAAVVLAALGAGGGGARSAAAVAVLSLSYSALVLASLASRPAGDGPAWVSGFGAALLLVSPQAPVVTSALLAVECALGLRGLGPELQRALARADLHALMAIALCSAAGALAAMLLTDVLAALLRRSREERARE